MSDPLEHFRSRVWYQFIEARMRFNFIVVYTERKRNALKALTIAQQVTAGGGIAGHIALNDIAPLIACFIFGALQLMKVVLPHFAVNEESVRQLDAAMHFFQSFLNQVEKLWFEKECGYIDDRQFWVRFYDLKKQEEPHVTAVNKLMSGSRKRLARKAEKEAENYIEIVFKSEQNEQ